MSDPGPGPDPVDQAYVQAEAMLSDDAARAARRARVLAAVANQPPAPPLRRASRPSPWRRGGWLAAACVAGVSLLVASQLYRPFWNQLGTSPPPPAAPSPPPPAAPTPPSPAAPPPLATLPSPSPPPPNAAAAPSAAFPAPPPAGGPVTATGPSSPPQAIAAPVAAAPPPPAPPPPPAEVAIAGDRAAPAPQTSVSEAPSAGVRDEAVAATARGDDRRQSSQGFEARAADAAQRLALADPAARLRAAAAAGRTADIEALLDQGAAVDAPDGDGNTALMLSIQADRPAAAALLRRHGASLDQRNHAGESARDLAAERGDAALDQAIGLAP